jgi:hypothetical protein
MFMREGGLVLVFIFFAGWDALGPWDEKACSLWMKMILKFSFEALAVTFTTRSKT